MWQVSRQACVISGHVGQAASLPSGPGGELSCASWASWQLVPRGARWLVLLAGLLVGAPPGVQAAQRIVLRNLQVISDKKVITFSEDGVQVEGGRVITWDEIERAKVAPEQQEAFDRMLAELGDHLYRIRRRLEDGDYKSLAPAPGSAKPAADKSLLSECEAVYPRYVGRHGKTAYMVFQGLMWARLEAGRREEAVEPYLDCYEHLRAVGPAKAALPGKRRLALDLKTGMTPDLVPVWFDPKAAAAAMPKVFEAVKRLKKPLPEAARIYYGTLALSAGQQETAIKVLGGIQDDRPAIVQLRDIALAQQEVLAGRPGEAVRRLESSLAKMDPANRSLATYWLGMAKVTGVQPATQREGVLQLLYLPALYGKTSPDLAAAGLYRSSKALAELKDAAGASSLRRELLARYGQTFHAARLKAELSPHKDNEVKP